MNSKEEQFLAIYEAYMPLLRIIARKKMIPPDTREFCFLLQPLSFGLARLQNKIHLGKDYQKPVYGLLSKTGNESCYLL